ncbi:MAG TPA: class I SAM-dependent methyltransferase [Pyrinomonadaceae bacterium]|nr:methyltransferase domain-containing protein [Acidobacteriota bacterium]HQZ97968.1 class I SAM-dependent methyltransferase [Pyrinomonadaceae bacterium]
MGGSIRKTLYKMAWDTRCRNVDVARILRPFVNAETTVLDAGCGEYGLSAFVAAKSVVGVDILPTDVKVDGFTFIHGSIITLPFAERSFSVAALVDVLEHLPEGLRPEAIRQLVRVAKDTIIITFPAGKIAREIDEAFNTKLVASHQEVPDWLSEHLENPYPDANEVAEMLRTEAENTGGKIKVTIHHSEHLSVARFLRNAASTSKYLYLFGNLAAGFLLPLMPKASEANGYRAIILAEFKND